MTGGENRYAVPLAFHYIVDFNKDKMTVTYGNNNKYESYNSFKGKSFRIHINFSTKNSKATISNVSHSA